MNVKEEHLHYFEGFRIGDITKQGVIDDLYFLTFDGFCGAYKDYAPQLGKKGLVAASIKGKTVLIGELLTHP